MPLAKCTQLPYDYSVGVLLWLNIVFLHVIKVEEHLIQIASRAKGADHHVVHQTIGAAVRNVSGR